MKRCEKPVENLRSVPTWVDEQGNKLKDPQDGEHPDKEGTTFRLHLVRIDKIKTVTSTTPEKPVEKLNVLLGWMENESKLRPSRW